MKICYFLICKHNLETNGQKYLKTYKDEGNYSVLVIYQTEVSHIFSENAIKNRWNSAAFKKRIFSFNYPKTCVEFPSSTTKVINIMEIKFDDNISKFINEANRYLDELKSSFDFTLRMTNTIEDNINEQKQINLISLEKVNIV